MDKSDLDINTDADDDEVSTTLDFEADPDALAQD